MQNMSSNGRYFDQLRTILVFRLTKKTIWDFRQGREAHLATPLPGTAPNPERTAHSPRKRRSKRCK